jgi:hypothetical protein
MTNQNLLFSSLFILLPLTFFYVKTNKSNYEYILANLLIINIILSLLFWSNPVKNGLIHIIDAFFARFSVICFLIYIVFLKKNSSLDKIIFYSLFLIGLFMFLCGGKESSKNWCSKSHINYHMCFHLFLSLAACYAF